VVIFAPPCQIRSLPAASRRRICQHRDAQTLALIEDHVRCRLTELRWHPDCNGLDADAGLASGRACIRFRNLVGPANDRSEKLHA
jgi:hypothetical protein